MNKCVNSSQDISTDSQPGCLGSEVSSGRVDPDALLTTEQAAQFLNFTTRALEAWRIRGGGPRFVRISVRAIRYRRRDLLTWAEERLATSTSDVGAP